MNKLYKEQSELDRVTGLNKTSFSRIGGLLFVVVGGLALAIWYLFNFTGTNSNTPSTVSLSRPVQQLEPLTVLSWNWYSYETTDAEGRPIKVGDKTIVGMLKNNSDKEYSYVQIEFNLYDENKNHVGTALANTNNLEPHSTWKFTAIPLIAATGQIKFAKLKGVSGY